MPIPESEAIVIRGMDQNQIYSYLNFLDLGFIFGSPSWRLTVLENNSFFLREHEMNEIPIKFKRINSHIIIVLNEISAFSSNSKKKKKLKDGSVQADWIFNSVPF